MSAVASAGPGSGVPAERSMCPREMWFSVVGRAEPAVSLLGAPVATVHPESSLSLTPRSGSSCSHTGVLAALQLRAAASQGSGSKRLFCTFIQEKDELWYGGHCLK